SGVAPELEFSLMLLRSPIPGATLNRSPRIDEVPAGVRAKATFGPPSFGDRRLARCLPQLRPAINKTRDCEASLLRRSVKVGQLTSGSCRNRDHEAEVRRLRARPTRSAARARK